MTRQGPRIVPGEAHETMAAALEAAAILQEQGLGSRIESYDTVYGRLLEASSSLDEPLVFALTFWDDWMDAANHDWQYHAPFVKDDWPRFAREIAVALLRGELPGNEVLVAHIRPKPRRSFRQWLRSLFGP